MSLTIRIAEETDYLEITKLTNQLGYPSSKKRVSEILDRFLNHDEHGIFVAEIDKKLVGYVHMVGSFRLGSEPFVEISAMIVHESFRRQGVGKGFLEKAEDWAKQHSYQNVRIRSNIIREEAHKFFIQRGFRNLKTQQVFLKQLSDPD